MTLLTLLSGWGWGPNNTWNPESDLPKAETQIITPSEFRAGVVPVTDPRLVQYFMEHPTELQEMNPRQFEELIAELMNRFGYQARIGALGKDGGVDVTAERQGVAAPELVLIQCKRYGP